VSGWLVAASVVPTLMTVDPASAMGEAQTHATEGAVFVVVVATAVGPVITAAFKLLNMVVVLVIVASICAATIVVGAMRVGIVLATEAGAASGIGNLVDSVDCVAVGIAVVVAAVVAVVTSAVAIEDELAGIENVVVIVQGVVFVVAVVLEIVVFGVDCSVVVPVGIAVVVT